MKANLKNILGLAALGMTLLATPVPTWAGIVSTDNVLIGSNQFASWARGNLVDARYSGNNPEQIGCKVQTLSSYSWTTCYAMDSAGRSLTCGSGDWKFLETLRGMTDSSLIYFSTDNNSSAGTCTNITVYNGSDMLK
jgi:hypothetical protein